MQLPDLWKKLKRRIRQEQGPFIHQERGKLDPYNSPLTFVLICGKSFNQSIPNAGTTCRMGWCRGFEQLGIPYLLISASDLAKRLPDIPNPICWISGSDYIYLDKVNLAALKRYRHCVWVATWFKDDVNFYQHNKLPNNSWTPKLNNKILSSEPTFIFTISPESSFEYYQNWIQHGAKLVSVPLACDTSLYHVNPPFCPEFDSIDMAFVGGYWPYKAQQFDIYLKPYQEKLKVFGYSPWPYAGYGGQLPEKQEPSLYHQAKLSPTVNEPHVSLMGIDINERVFKVLGSGGMTITDATPAYREWFTEEELLVPTSVNEFYEMVHLLLNDEGLNTKYRQAGYKAVLHSHTYVHRAKLVLSSLGIEAF
ncbi:glycosyltransferase [Anabaena sp. AL93]|uniref:glycosyltransferase family protein n=1 Tax=Anabaena sp. AL93 TaxID=1678133 RepID=UPI000801A8C1|nr:glycosyltransferase [Anabaena sp. AL93]OBQ17353.1 MAG: hypothetical protein AN486_15505 [Anabaena sp. AL93]